MADALEQAKAEVMLAGYDARWGGDQYEVLAVEAEFQAPLINPETGAPSRTWMLAGKLDVLVREMASPSRVLLVEHKTASGDVGAGSDYVKRLRLDGQISIYYDGAEALGSQVDGCLYDVLVKLALRPLKATPTEARKFTKDGRLYANQRERDESPEEYRARLIAAISEAPNDYFMRAEVVRLAAEMDEARFDIWGIAKQLREAELAGRFPRNPDACVRFGRTCEFFGVCTGEASLEDPSLYRRSEVIHPELSTNVDARLLTSSRLSAARACQRLHKFKFTDGLRAVAEAESLRFGTLIHRGLEAWWKARDGERLPAALAAIAEPSSAATSVATAA